MQENAAMPTTESAWRVGPGYIDFADLYLLEIHQVSRASLQPVLAYRPRLTAAQPSVYRTYAPVMNVWP